MRLQRLMFVSLASVGVLAGCGSKAVARTTTVVSATAAVRSSSTVAASVTTSAAAKGSVDCAAVKSAIGSLIVNWQLVAQLPKKTNVADWSEVTKSFGTIDKFAGQLDVLMTNLRSDPAAAKAIEFMNGANVIVQKGLAGDSTAPKALGDYLGPDLAVVLAKKVPLGEAVSAAGCK